MSAQREPLLTDVLFMLGGVLGIAIAMATLGNNIVYLPNDVRSQPWFDPLVSSIMVLLSLFIFILGAVRLLQRLRERNKQG
jgi:uncharacterized membrane protein YdjX (TVP38/TMEM64 family)